MCGIAGILSKDDKDVVPLLRGMLETIEHRGPDGAGITASGKVCHAKTVAELDWDSLQGNSAMGHTRLAVVGGQRGQQPFVSNDGQIVLLHNGEIYNYKALRSSLESHYQFDTETDSEVLVHLLSQHYNDDLLEAFSSIAPQLDGVYAIAASDGKQARRFALPLLLTVIRAPPVYASVLSGRLFERLAPLPGAPGHARNDLRVEAEGLEDGCRLPVHGTSGKPLTLA